MDAPPGFRLERGLLWPDDDVSCAENIFGQLDNDFPRVMARVRDHSVVAQAGGNCGLWPRALSPLFGAVYTAEPDASNFVALTWNTAHLSNVVRLQCALGEERKMVRMVEPPTEPHNCGALHVAPGGHVPTLLLDDLALQRCGLIYLDVEGFEFPVLRGALRTIRRCRPVIAIEDKGMSERFGDEIGATAEWLRRFCEYEVTLRLGRDVVLEPREQL